MKKFFAPLLVLAFLIIVVDDANAQRRGKKKRRRTQETEETTSSRSSRDRRDDEFEGVPLADKLNYEFKPGNLQFFGNQLSISFKSNVGYKLNNTFTAGLGGKLFYDYINSSFSSGDISAFSYGGMVFGRAKLTQTFYLQAEYNLVSFGPVSVTPQETIAYPTAGIGYVQRGYDWSVGLELLAVLDGVVRDKPQGTIVEYWINFSKNF